MSIYTVNLNEPLLYDLPRHEISLDAGKASKKLKKRNLTRNIPFDNDQAERKRASQFFQNLLDYISGKSVTKMKELSYQCSVATTLLQIFQKSVFFAIQDMIEDGIFTELDLAPDYDLYSDFETIIGATGSVARIMKTKGKLVHKIRFETGVIVVRGFDNWKEFLVHNFQNDDFIDTNHFLIPFFENLFDCEISGNGDERKIRFRNKDMMENYKILESFDRNTRAYMGESNGFSPHEVISQDVHSVSVNKAKRRIICYLGNSEDMADLIWRVLDAFDFFCPPHRRDFFSRLSKGIHLEWTSERKVG